MSVSIWSLSRLRINFDRLENNSIFAGSNKGTSCMIDKLVYETPIVEIVEIVPESVLAGSVEDPEVNPEIDW